MLRGRNLLKKIILLNLVIVVYVFFSSTVIEYHSEQKVSTVLVDQVMEWNYRHFGIHKQIIEREKRLSAPADADIISRLNGRILLQVESAGEMWYLNPDDSKRYYIGKARDIWSMANKFKEEIYREDFIEYNFFEKAFPENLQGKFIALKNGESGFYYVDPTNAQAVELFSVEDAWETAKTLGLGVRNEDIRKIPVGDI